ncbi:hypothetical protein IWX49DRAFT_267310 [Phyllosticta citricarpa]|uniref:U4/U6.U5 small nuclear ribonucleoprotein 27kDa protein domain-containing protein n=1 Tax=Phyllosticta paracitricarpa TaxID=2016321 RepID=A0ABR1N1S2_9PEZI
MVDPGFRRSRRPDSASMWDNDDRSRPPPSRGPRDGGRKDGGRFRSRSRDRHDDRRVGDKRGDRSDSRDRRRRGIPDIFGSRFLLTGTDDRDRSRSPRPHDSRDRRRSPPRGPRGPAPERGGAGRPRKGAGSLPFAGGVTQPSARPWEKEYQPPQANGNTNGESMDVDREDVDPEEAEMHRVMGFSKFRSTHEQKVPGNEYNYAVKKEKVTKYRQYMNRTGGFNRPLSPSR